MSMYDDWLQASAELKRAKAKEMELRLAICADILDDKVEGTATQFVEDKRYKATATAKLTRSLDRSILEVIWEDLTDEEKACIDYKPNIVLANYRRIEEEGGKLIEAVTVKPATPTLKIVEVTE